MLLLDTRLGDWGGGGGGFHKQMMEKLITQAFVE